MQYRKQKQIYEAINVEKGNLHVKKNFKDIFEVSNEMQIESKQIMYKLKIVYSLKQTWPRWVEFWLFCLPDHKPDACKPVSQ